MTAKQILAELKPLGSDSYKKVMLRHGVKDPFFGVKIGDLQKFRKRIKKKYQLALDLYDTGNYDAMYLAGLIADDAQMTKRICNAGLRMRSTLQSPASPYPGSRPAAHMGGSWVWSGLTQRKL